MLLLTLSMNELLHARIACKNTLTMEQLVGDKFLSCTWSLLRDAALPRMCPVALL